ncbi:MAG: hypothetical protein KBT03_09570 [Bacteroidales bacterium]|nr:hypothetical protein [Candidatus Scybalousia scybalohippi]
MMTYREYINAILSMRENTKKKDVYMERHHIIPKCMGGDNSPENLVWLFPREHFIAHKLLYLENKGITALSYAYWNMSHCIKKGRYKLTELEYEQARKEHSKNMSGKNNPNYGVRMTEEERKKSSVLHKKIAKKLSEEHIRKLKIKNSHPFTPVHKKKISESRLKSSKKIINLTTGNIYGSIIEASRSLGINRCCISDCLFKRQKTAGGYKWGFYKESE